MQMRLKDGKSKVLTLSYDDNNVQDVRLVEIFNRYGLKATFNMSTGYFFGDEPGKEYDGSRLTWDKAREIYASHEVAVHSLTHPWLLTLKSHEVIKEILEDKKRIEKNFHTIAKGMAYPFNCYDKTTIEIIKLCGIAYSRTAFSTHKFEFPTDWIELNPTCHHGDPQLMELADKFINNDPKWNICSMFYVWGHSYEFDEDNNWDLIEKFAQKVSGKDDVWYATNGEIYDYVTAYDRLEVSADNTIVYNPSAMPVWFRENNKTYKIEPGEKLFIG